MGTRKSTFQLSTRKGSLPLQRSLKSASDNIRLGDLVPKDVPDVETAILNLIYYDARLPLFHAKEGRDFYPPADSVIERRVVSRALSTLTQIVLRMAEAWFQARRVGGGVFFGWVYEQAAGLLRDAVMVPSEDSTPFDATESDLTHPRFLTSPRLAASLAPELQRGKAPSFLGGGDFSDLRGLRSIRRIDVVTPTHPVFAQCLESELTLDGIGRLEALMHVRATNLNQPKSMFRL